MKMLALFICILLSIGTHACVVLAQSLSYPGEWIVGQTVNTTSGSIIGHASAFKPLVSEYLGIPFAQAPVGPLRFKVPQPFQSSDTFTASKYGASCPANVSRRPNATTVRFEKFSHTLLDHLQQVDDAFDEDCLRLNVWTRPQSGEAKKAVLVWIYGGGFNSGSTRSPGYSGAHLANKHDVVVVSMGYRTNIFGFPRAEFLDDQNLGLLDQRLALEWVRDNIEKFGGDGSRITLFGQSAGGASVDHHTMAWADDPIAHAFIAMSGFASDSNRTIGSNSNMSAGWYAASEKLGCGDISAGRQTLECMQSKPWRDIADAITKRGVTPNTGPGGFGPIVDNKIVFGDVTRRRKEGLFAKKPLMIGNTGNEGALYEFLAIANGRPPNSTNPNQTRCGPRSVARSRVDHQVPAYRYVYMGEYPNQDIGVRGAWHGSDIGMAFGTNEYMSHRASTPEEKDLSWIMATAWTDFAKQPWFGPRMMGWPVYSDNDPTVVRLGGPNSSEIMFEPSGKFTEGCPPPSYN